MRGMGGQRGDSFFRLGAAGSPRLNVVRIGTISALSVQEGPYLCEGAGQLRHGDPKVWCEGL